MLKNHIKKRFNQTDIFFWNQQNKKKLKVHSNKRMTGARVLPECYMNIIWTLRKRCDKKFNVTEFILSKLVGREILKYI